MPELSNNKSTAMGRLRWPLLLTRVGMVAERVTVAFWPLWSIIFLGLAALMFGLHQTLPLEFSWAAAVLLILGGTVALVLGIRRLRWPTALEARARLDASLPGQPISAVLDDQVIGSGDPVSEAVWKTHIQRMAVRAAGARAVAPNLRISRRDPFALRYVATLALVMAVIFGSAARLASVSDLVSGVDGAAYATGPAWEGWVEPPAYTGKPSIYLADIKGGALTVPAGSRLTVRLYGKIGSLTVAETVSGRTDDIGSAAASQTFLVLKSGSVAIEGDGGESWQITVIPDAAPTVEIDGQVERRASGVMHLPFSAQDDYGVQSGYAELDIDLGAVDRRFGLAAEPEPRDLITLDLPMPFNGDRRAFAETMVENLAQHPWAGLPVRVSLFALDAGDNTGMSEPQTITLPGRRFFDPLAAAIIEQRRDLLWNRLNAPQVALVLRAVSHRPDDLFESATAYLKLRVAIRRLETGFRLASVSTELRSETAQALWDIAVLIEDGNLSDAKERLNRAQDRLEQAMRDGASEDEIAELMEELRQAMQDYLRQLAEQQGDQDTDFANSQQGQEITDQQMQDMLDRLQQLMEQGRMSEAQELMDQLRRMMENMQVTQGQGQPGPGQQALNDLSDTLRDQQNLNDDTFGDLQDQFDQQQGEPGQQGQGGQQGQQQGQRGQGGQQGQQQGQRGQGGQQPGVGQGRGGGNDPAQGLAQRQRTLRGQLEQQSRNLPGTATPGGNAAREALDRAGRAMEGAEQALRDDDFAGALDNQSEALEALRDGMRELAEQLAQQQNRQTGQEGQAFGRAGNDTQRDPLGRDVAGTGRVGTDEQILQGEDVYRRAQELLLEIRRRSSQQERPTTELDYLRRLLERF